MIVNRSVIYYENNKSRLDKLELIISGLFLSDNPGKFEAAILEITAIEQ